MAPPSQPSDNKRGLSVLIVEDEALVAMDLEFMLEDTGHAAIALADSLETAIKAVEAERPDIALVDIQLAFGESGLEVAKELTERGIPVLFSTGNCPGEAGRPLAMGCMHKPIVERSLRAALKAAEARIEGREVSRLPSSVHFY
ncbi:response regulator [Qipengyuania nanhaisediminis]|uniref:response regulator n=1 Tax=Qipengyuania nanhaisediminis TaxID=604088 RepID=UPI0038B367C7